MKLTQAKYIRPKPRWFVKYKIRKELNMKTTMILINKLNQLDDLRLLNEMGVRVQETEENLLQEILELLESVLGVKVEVV